MAIINLYTKSESKGFDVESISCDSVISWIVKNISKDDNFRVYEGGINKSNEITKNPDRVLNAKEVSVFILPAAGAVALTVAAVVLAVVAVTVLTPKISALSNVNRNQQSPNNDLSARNNVARPNQRIVDICGKVKSIPDVLQREFSRYVNNTEERIGYYCVARNRVQIEDVKDGDSFISDIKNASAGVYYPFKSPNNSTPDIQIGEAINEPVASVFQSSDAIGQTLKAPNEGTLALNDDIKAFSEGYFLDETGEFDFTDSFEVGDIIDLENIFVSTGFRVIEQIAQNTSLIIAVEKSKITFDITSDSSWSKIDGGDSFIRDDSGKEPKISNSETKLIGPFRITSNKIDRLLVNTYAANGLYKDGKNGRKRVSVDFTVNYQKLNDNFEPVGPLTPVSETIAGGDSDERGITTDIDLGGETFVEWSLERVTPKDFDFEGSIVDEIKLKDVFGLLSIDKEEFGNVTTIQTKRSSVAQATAIRNPELNCIATELVYKYENGAFATELTPNTQAIQSLLRLALDPYVGRRTESELNFEALITAQEENETYFQSPEGGQFNYSFDSTKTSAQEIFFTICQPSSIHLWREGRVLNAWFEKPQLVPSMVFTHRSKQAGSESWLREFGGDDKKDSIEFVYTDADLYTTETLYYPTDRSGTNPLRVEMPGVKGKSQATWQMMRRFNKLKYQEESVDFTATAEGRFVKPKQMISVVKGSRMRTYDGNITAVDGVFVTLSQDVEFTENDEHYLIIKKRDGSTESLLVSATDKKRVVQLNQLPSEEIYTGNSALKTEFSFGNEARLSAQNMIPEEITPSDARYVKIKAINYSDLYYKDDPVQPVGKAHSNGFSNGFS